MRRQLPWMSSINRPTDFPAALSSKSDHLDAEHAGQSGRLRSSPSVTGMRPLPGLRAIAAVTERYARARMLRVPAATVRPRMSSSPCMRRRPQVGLSLARRTISSRIEGTVRGRPGRFGWGCGRAAGGGAIRVAKPFCSPAPSLPAHWPRHCGPVGLIRKPWLAETNFYKIELKLGPCLPLPRKPPVPRV